MLDPMRGVPSTNSTGPLVQETSWYSRQQEALAELTSSALVLPDERALMDKAVALLATCLGVDYCHVFECLPNGGGLWLRSGQGWNEELIGHTTAAIEDGSRLSQLLLEGANGIIEEIGPDFPESDIFLLRSLGVASGISVVIPQLPGTGPYGLLGVHSTRGREFTDCDRCFLKIVAHLIAADLARKRVEKDAALLRNVALAVGLAASLELALVAALKEVLRVTEWDCGEAWLPTADGSRLENGGSSAGSRTDLEEFVRRGLDVSFSPKEGLPGRVWDSREAEWVIDISSPTSDPGSLRDLAALAGLHTALGIPLVAKEHVLAVLVFYMSTPRRRDQRIVQLISDAFATFAPLIERKRLEESQARLASIVDSLAEAIIGMAARGTILSWNAGASQVFGYTAEEVVGQSISLLVPDDRRQEVRSVLRKIRKGNSVRDLETIWKAKNSGAIRVLLTMSPVKDAMGRVTGISAIAHDLNRRKETEHELPSVR